MKGKRKQFINKKIGSKEKPRNAKENSRNKSKWAEKQENDYERLRS